MVQFIQIHILKHANTDKNILKNASKMTAMIVIYEYTQFEKHSENATTSTA